MIVCEAGGASWLPFVSLGDVKTTRSSRRAVEAVWVRDAQPRQVGLFA